MEFERHTNIPSLFIFYVYRCLTIKKLQYFEVYKNEDLITEIIHSSEYSSISEPSALGIKTTSTGFLR